MTESPKRKIGARLGIVGYGSVLRQLQQGASTTEQVCAAHIGCMNTTRFVIRKMHAVKLIHVAGWAPRATRCGGYTQLWGFGAGPDVQYPDGGQPLRTPSRSNNVSSSMVALSELLRALQEPCTKAELQDCTGLNEETIRKFLEHARRIHLVRIAGWQPTEGDGYSAALWQLGAGPTPPRPKAIPRAQIHRAQTRKRSEARKALRMHNAMFGTALEAA